MKIHLVRHKAIDAAKNAANSLERYVENPASILVPELSKTYDLESERIAIGFGSDDLLARIARAYLRCCAARTAI